MNDQESLKIENSRITINGKGDFAEIICAALIRTGFRHISYAQEANPDCEMAVDLEMVGDADTAFERIPVVYPFDFIEGGAAMVVLPGDESGFDIRGDIRLAAAKYMMGYCAFWNIENSDWLRVVLPRIENGEQSVKAKKTAAGICAGILAALAAGREVKHFPRFYLSHNLE